MGVVDPLSLFGGSGNGPCLLSAQLEPLFMSSAVLVAARACTTGEKEERGEVLERTVSTCSRYCVCV